MSRESTEWCVWWGGEDPNDCAGMLAYDDQAEAEEMTRWITGGRVASRTMTRGAWVTVSDREPYCNHDAAAIVDGVCECGEAVQHSEKDGPWLERLREPDDITCGQADEVGRS